MKPGFRYWVSIQYSVLSFRLCNSEGWNYDNSMQCTVWTRPAFSELFLINICWFQISSNIVLLYYCHCFCFYCSCSCYCYWYLLSLLLLLLFLFLFVLLLLVFLLFLFFFLLLLLLFIVIFFVYGTYILDYCRCTGCVMCMLDYCCGLRVV